MGQVLRLDTGYVPEPQEIIERPISKGELAAILGISTRTIDRWVSPGCPRRGRLPQDTGHRVGCWIQAGCHRRYYLSRVREWLDGDL